MPSPVIAHANRRRFAPGEHTHNGPVRSVMQLWCRSGHGHVIADGKGFDMQAGSMLLLPFEHDIHYQAERRHSWLVAGLHVIPNCQPPAGQAPPFYQVPHTASHPLATAPWIDNAADLALSQPRSWQLAAEHPCLLLAEYVVSRFIDQSVCEQDMRQLAAMMLQHWRTLLAQNDITMAPALSRIDEELKQNPRHSPSLADCCRIAGVSKATLGRLAQQHWGRSVQQHIRQQKINIACELLRSSDDTVKNIARHCGFADPLYFSRVFTHELGMSPRAWRQRYGRL